MAEEYVLKSSVLNAIHSGDIDMGMVTPREYRLLKDLSERIDRRIQRVPAADVQPVRHGRWIWDEANWWHKCSACGMTFGYDDIYELFDHGFQLANYCPNCGAKMDGGET